GSGPDPDSEDIEFAEVQLEADLTDRLSVWLRYNRSETDNQPNIDALRAPYATSVFQGALVPFAQFGLTNNPAEFDNRRVRTDHDGFSRLDADQVTLEVSYAFDQFELKYIGSYNEYEFSYSRDADDTDQASIDYPLVDPATFLPIPLSVSTYAVNHIEENKEFTSHELQFITSGEGRLQFIGGLYYYEEDIDQPFHLRLPFEPALQTPFSFVTFGPGNANPDGDFYYQLGSIESEAFAAYGQFDLELSDRLNLTLGLRYTEDEKDGYEEQRIVLYNPAANVFGAFGFPLPPTTSIDISLNGNGPATRSLENEWDAVTGKIGLDFQLNEDILFYGYAARGYKSGGMRLGQLEGLDLTQPGGISLSNSPFVDEETVWAYEAGMKSDLADGKLRLNLTAFYYDYEDQQAPVSFTDTTGVVLQDFINVPETSSYGFEAETIWYPTDNLQLIANYGYLKAEIEADLLLVDNALPVPETVNVKGNVLPKSPEHKVTLAASYYLDTAIGNFNFTANWSRYSEQYASFFERDLYEIDSYSIAGARITYWTNDESLRVILGVNNLTDEDAPTETLRAATAENGFARVEAPLAPRVVFLELTKSFGS
ncbi:MAG: TonB-dependent receptor, partial [Pseudomonadota bacterium]